MSNNKQSMKLYTEEQMRQAFNCGSLYLGREGDTNFHQLIDKLTPIELPSDEELHHLSPGYKSETDYDIGFLHGWNTGVKVYYDIILDKTI